MTTTSQVAVWNRALHVVGETDLVQVYGEDRPAAEACRLIYDDMVREVFEAYPWRWAIRERKLTSIDDQTYTWTYNDDGVTPYLTWDIPFPFVNSSQVTVTHIDSAAAETELAADTDYSFSYPEFGGSRARVVLASALVGDESLRIDVTTTRVGWDHLYPLPADCVTPIALLPLDTLYDSLPVAGREPFEVMVNDAGDGLLLCTNMAETDMGGLAYVALVSEVSVWPRSFLEAVVWRMASSLALALKKDPGLAGSLIQVYNQMLDRAAAQSQNVGQRGQRPMTPTESSRG